MGFEKPSFENTPEKNKDFNDEDVVSGILESNNFEDIKELTSFKKWQPEQVELYSSLAMLRKETLDNMESDLENRKKEKPIADNEELNMGVYKEQIEPQVREAVLKMRRKGYSTYESGFYWLNNQIVSFEEKHLENFQLPQDLVEKMNLKGVDVVIEPDSILLTLNKSLKLDEIQEIWNEIESKLPNLGKSVQSSNIEAAESFKIKQEEIKDKS